MLDSLPFFFQNKMNRARGNALFLVLIAVALFAALSYAVTMSGRSGSGGTRAENAALLAAQIIDSANTLGTAIMRMTLSGTPDASVIYDVSGTNNCPGFISPFCTSGSNCVFSSDGGGAGPLYTPQAAFVRPYGTNMGGYPTLARLWGPNMVGCNGLIVNGAGTGAGDLIVTYEDITPDVCFELNRKLGIASIQGPNAWGTTFGLTPGQFSGCVQQVAGSATTYMYYHLLKSY